MIYDASFIIYVNYNGERLGLCKWVHEAVPDAEWKVAWFGSTSHCYVSVDENK